MFFHSVTEKSLSFLSLCINSCSLYPRSRVQGGPADRSKWKGLLPGAHLSDLNLHPPAFLLTSFVHCLEARLQMLIISPFKLKWDTTYWLADCFRVPLQFREGWNIESHLFPLWNFYEKKNNNSDYITFDLLWQFRLFTYCYD